MLLKQLELLDGKTATTFASDQEITRGELAIWLQRAFDLKAGSEELAFTDVADRYEAAVKALVAMKSQTELLQQLSEQKTMQNVVTSLYSLREL